MLAKPVLGYFHIEISKDDIQVCTAASLRGLHQNCLSRRKFATSGFQCPFITTCRVIGFTMQSSFFKWSRALNWSRNTSTSPSIFLTNVNFMFPPRLESWYTGSSLLRVRVTKYARLGAHSAGGRGATGSGMSLGGAGWWWDGCRVG